MYSVKCFHRIIALVFHQSDNVAYIYEIIPLIKCSAFTVRKHRLYSQYKSINFYKLRPWRAQYRNDFQQLCCFIVEKQASHSEFLKIQIEWGETRLKMTINQFFYWGEKPEIFRHPVENIFKQIFPTTTPFRVVKKRKLPSLATLDFVWVGPRYTSKIKPPFIFIVPWSFFNNFFKLHWVCFSFPFYFVPKCFFYSALSFYFSLTVNLSLLTRD